MNIVMPDWIQHPVSLNAARFWINSPPDRVSLVRGFGVCAVQNDGTSHQPQPPTVTLTSFFAE
jgi:hypothetical protein